MTDIRPYPTRTLARTYLSQGYTDQALAVFRDLLQDSPDDAELKAFVNDLAHSESKPQVRMPAEKQALPGLFQTWIDLCLRCRKLRRLKEIENHRR